MMLFNNLIFSPLAGHKLVLRGGFLENQDSQFRVQSSNRPLMTSHRASALSPQLCVVSLALLPVVYV